MSSTTHSSAQYIKIFYILLALTIIEVAIVYLGLPKMLLAAPVGDLRGVEGRFGGDAFHAP